MKGLMIMIEDEIDFMFIEPRKDYDSCIVGIDQKNGRVIYSVNLIIDVIACNTLKRLGRSSKKVDRERRIEDIYADAEEYYTFNILGANMGEREPIYLYEAIDHIALEAPLCIGGIKDE